MTWTRRTLLESAVISSFAGLLIPFAIAKFIGVKYVAIWLAVRAAAQVVTTILPNPANELFASSGGGLDPAHAKRIEDGLAWFYLRQFLVSLPVSVVIIYLAFGNSAAGSEKLLLAVYVSLLITSSLMGVLVRVRLRGDLTKTLAKQDLAFSLVALIASVFGFKYLVLVFAAREAVKIARISELFEGFSMVGVPWLKTYRESSWIYARNIVQVLSQYAERLALPAIFGLAVSGYAGLGSTVGTTLIMLSSTLYVWAFRDLIEGRPSVESVILDELVNLLMASASLLWWILGAALLLGLEWEASGIAAATATFSSMMGVSFLVLARSRAVLMSARGAIEHFAAISLVYSAVFVARHLGLDFEFSLLCGVVTTCAYIVLAYSRTGRAATVKLWIACTVMAISFALGIYFSRKGLSYDSGCVGIGSYWAVAAVLSSPCAAHFLKRRNR